MNHLVKSAAGAMGRYKWMERRRKYVVLTAATLLLILVLVFGFMQKNSHDAATEFGPWYPMQNENGDPAVADFENHIPCVTTGNQPIKKCDRMKFGLVLYRDAKTKAPTTYIMSRVYVGVSSERSVNKGAWEVTKGNGLDAQAVDYKLDANAPEEFRNFWAIGDDILFILNDDLKPRVGDAAYGYALNRIPLGQVYRVPAKK
jgi:hypothetical protein